MVNKNLKKTTEGKVIRLCNKDMLYVSFVDMLLQIYMSINKKD